jgi:3-mercaptopyruvate sulfurtransferase SseA
MHRSLVLLSLLLALPASAAPPPSPQGSQAAPAPPAAPPAAPAPAPTPVNTDSVRRVPLAEAQQAVKDGKAVIVDVRSAADYKIAHVHGALSIPLAEIEQRSKELPRDSFIITYCT